MSHQLDAGGLGDPGDAGIPPEFAGSMAEMMEEAMNELLQAEGREPLSTVNSRETRDRRIMFVAIARGIVRHLVEQAGAFDVEELDGTPVPNRRIRIESTGP